MKKSAGEKIPLHALEGIDTGGSHRGGKTQKTSYPWGGTASRAFSERLLAEGGVARSSIEEADDQGEERRVRGIWRYQGLFLQEIQTFRNLLKKIASTTRN